jgi:outer membrane protein OmpA-like peptidoglycan-associated protein
MKLRSALLAATVLAAAPVAAKAQAISGLYIGAGAGANFMQEENISSVTFPQRSPFAFGANATNQTNINFQAGFVGLLSVGYGLGNGLRFEVEGAYRSNKLNGVSNNLVNSNNTNIPGTGAGGNEQKYSAMVNVLYDFDPAVLGLGFLPVVPYVGVGVGYTWSQFQNGHIYGNGFAPAVLGGPGTGFSTLFRTNQGDGAFSYQAIIGASFPITAVPGLSLTAEYRFLGLAGDRETNWQYYATGPQPGGVNTRAVIKTGDDYNHSDMVCDRYAFNAAPPPPVAVVTPPPAREAARTYLVFFDWDRADLTPRARQVVSEAAQATTRVQVTRIQVNGYTDTSGTPRYNQGLSVRRAQSVANELVRDGVPRQAISIQGFGETHLLVPTADGVREPQNRRVEIILQ